ncbi:hypothetical protein Vadar_031105 [Vaccinium darrowii]|uniref:Uncharacterized protein n=1 Tax=Vaccinium darrowii TaxID=229202 RepID=A0ACB7ZFM0_9ERIC|nr:hypothetical protein Vadar_031105 [Vaccinium darrowii]
MDFITTCENEEMRDCSRIDETLHIISGCAIDVWSAPPSLEVPPKLELKPLLANLKYVFLGAEDTLLVIIASDLSAMQESLRVEVLKKHKGAIGWSVADLKV